MDFEERIVRELGEIRQQMTEAHTSIESKLEIGLATLPQTYVTRAEQQEAKALARSAKRFAITSLIAVAAVIVAIIAILV